MSERIEIAEATLLAYLNQELNEVDAEKVRLWLDSSETNMKKYNDIKSTWEITGSLIPAPVVVDTDQAWNKVYHKINTTEVISMAPQKTNYRPWLIAASIALLVGLVFVIQPYIGTDTEALMAENSTLIETLTDGTEIALEANSVLTYDKNFDGKERRVSLEGECKFEVAKDPAKPFVIDLPNDTYVKVLGTVFTVTANKNASYSEIRVFEGRVEFGKPGNTVELVANESAVFNNETNEILVNRVNLPSEMDLDQELTFEFDGDPLSSVLKELSDSYQVSIISDCIQVQTLPVRSHHKNESLEEILEVIGLALGFTVEENSNSGKKEYRLICDE